MFKRVLWSQKHPGAPRLVLNSFWGGLNKHTYGQSANTCSFCRIRLLADKCSERDPVLLCGYTQGVYSSLLKVPHTCNIIHQRCKNRALHLWLHTTPNVLVSPNPWLQQHHRASPLFHSAWSVLQGQRSTASTHQWILHTSSLVVVLLFWADQNSSNNINLLGQSTCQGLKEKALWSHPSTQKCAQLCTVGPSLQLGKGWHHPQSLDQLLLLGAWFIFQT